MSEIDLFFAKLANQFRESCGSFFTPIFKVYTFLGNSGWFFILFALALLWFKKTRILSLTLLLGMLFGFLLTNVLLKNIVARNRPFMDESSVYYQYWTLVGSLKESGYSLPSGHSTVSMVFGSIMLIFFKKKYSWLFLFVPLLMGFTRIYFMVHYFSDVLLGWTVGAICGVSAYFIIKELIKREKVRKFFFLEKKEEKRENA